MAERKRGKPYIWVTWLAGLLGGDRCYWKVWFKARFKYEKFETQGADLAKWAVEHDALMKIRRTQLEKQGYKTTVEGDNDFKLEGNTADVAGKPDLIAVHPGDADVPKHGIISDGKTGRKKDSDRWQVLLYLYAVVKRKCRPDLPAEMSGEIYYKRGDEQVDVALAELTPAAEAEIVRVIKIVASEEEPRRWPSKDECFKCNIPKRECPERLGNEARDTAKTNDF